MKERIAKITETHLGWQDHGILTAMIHLSYGGGSMQWTPGHFCDETLGHDADFKRRGTAYGMEFIARLMRACGVNQWENLKGRTIIALIDDNDQIAGIKPLPTEGGTEFVFAELRAMFEAQSA